MSFLHCFCRATFAAIVCLIGATSLAQADWAACQSKPTRGCILEEAFSRNGVAVTGKDRLDALIEAGALRHVEYATAADLADAQRLALSTDDASATNCAMLAVNKLAAGNQKQQALDLVSSLTGVTQLYAIRELTHSFVEADDLDAALALTDRVRPPLNASYMRNIIAIEAEKVLAENGKIEKALTLIADERDLSLSDVADMQAVVGQAYAKRGDMKTAKEFFDRAEKHLQAAIERATIRTDAVVMFRFSSIRLLALSGDGEGVKTALQQMQAKPGAAAPDARTDYARRAGNQRVVAALLETRQVRTAVDVAESLTATAEKDNALAAIVSAQASDGRLSDARTTFALLTDPGATPARQTALRSLAAATAKTGDIAAALQMIGQIHAPTSRAAALFLVAQAMPQ